MSATDPIPGPLPAIAGGIGTGAGLDDFRTLAHSPASRNFWMARSQSTGPGMFLRDSSRAARAGLSGGIDAISLSTVARELAACSLRCKQVLRVLSTYAL